MNYRDITFNDPNRIKRWLQSARLKTAIELSANYLNNNSNYLICDFGAGNGELCKLLTNKYKKSNIICYEPTSELYNEAKENLSNLNINLINNIDSISDNSLDVLFCLEVFEHLPANETKEAFNIIFKKIKSNGLIIVGIPIEVGIPALYKGVFRMFRRYGSYDANLSNIIKSFFWMRLNERPSIEITPGFNYYSAHMGFNYRSFEKQCKEHFNIIKKTTSPFNIFGSFFMPEINFAMKKIR